MAAHWQPAPAQIDRVLERLRAFGHEGVLTWVPLTKINYTDWALPRWACLGARHSDYDLPTIATLRQVYRGTGAVAPAEGYVNPTDGLVWITDGNHRIAAAKRERIRLIPVVLTGGGALPEGRGRG
jgi:hypothetical protein